MVKIYLDAGHGGKDSGATGNGLYEKNIALDLTKRIEAKLNQYQNVEIMQTRTTDIFLELAERTDKANAWKADVFVSCHLNANPNTAARGFESFVYNGTIDASTTALQNVMHQEIVKMITDSGVTDRGKNKANFHVLRESNMRAILCENLFITNPTDAALMKQDSFLDKLAQGYVNGLEKFFGLVKETRPPTEISPETPTTGTLYQVIAGTYSDLSNAQDQVKKLAADGYSAYINKK